MRETVLFLSSSKGKTLPRLSFDSFLFFLLLRLNSVHLIMKLSSRFLALCFVVSFLVVCFQDFSFLIVCLLFSSSLSLSFSFSLRFLVLVLGLFLSNRMVSSFASFLYANRTLNQRRLFYRYTQGGQGFGGAQPPAGGAGGAGYGGAY